MLFGLLISLLLNFISSTEMSLKAQEIPHMEPWQEAKLTMAQTVSTASCSQIDYSTYKNYKQKNSERQFDFEEAVFVDPPNFNGATLVGLGLYVINISNVNAVENTYRLEGLIDLVWCDPRLKFNAKDQRNQQQVYLEEDAATKIQRIWWPSITFVNEVGEYFRKNEELVISSDGTVEYKERFSVELKSFFDLRKFPFDEQTLDVEIESFAWDENSLKLNKEDKRIGFSPHLNLPEWEIGDSEIDIQQSQEIRSQKPFSKFLMHIKLIRKPGFYLWKVIIPLIILVIISWSVFWMIGESLADRISFSLTGILTVVAYQFLISENLPNISYLTLMDAILSLSFLAMALTVAENIVINWLKMGNLELAAYKVDRLCQVAFPTAYVILLFSISLFYLTD